MAKKVSEFTEKEESCQSSHCCICLQESHSPSRGCKFKPSTINEHTRSPLLCGSSQLPCALRSRLYATQRVISQPITTPLTRAHLLRLAEVLLVQIAGVTSLNVHVSVVELAARDRSGGVALIRERSSCSRKRVRRRLHLSLQPDRNFAKTWSTFLAATVAVSSRYLQ